MRKSVFSPAAVGCAVLFLASVPMSAQAEDPELAALRQQLKELSNMLQSFDARLNKLEQQRGAAGGAAAASASAAASAPMTSTPPASPQSDSTAVQRPAATQTARADTGAAARAPSREGWLKMKDGMTQAEIDQLLGPPQTTFVLEGKTVWYYIYPGVGAASVFFNSDGRASSHQAPSFGPFVW